MNVTSTAHAKLTAHLEKHMYKRGYNIGDAPADNRGKTNFRVVKRGENIAVRFHSTDILTAYPNGDIMLDCRGWASATTTRAAMDFALRRFQPSYTSMGIRNFKSNSQLCLYLPGSRVVRYYDGIRISQTGEVLTPLQAFRCVRMNTEKSKALADGVKASGFKDMFAMLYNTAKLEHKWAVDMWRCGRHDTITNSANAEHWQGLVAGFKFVGDYRHESIPEGDTPARAWTRCMSAFKTHMYETVDTEVTAIINGEAT
jgi:hypothetical protein